MIEADPARLSAQSLSATDLVNALLTSNVIVPAGLARIGDREYNVGLNSSPSQVELFNDLPVGMRNGVSVLVRDVAKVSDSFAVQTTIVHVDGHRAAYLPILKHSDASTLKVVNATRDMLPSDPGNCAEGTAPQPRFRSIGFRSRRGQQCSPRGGRFVRSRVADDPCIPRQLAEYLSGLRDHTAVDRGQPRSVCSSPDKRSI